MNMCCHLLATDQLLPCWRISTTITVSTTITASLSKYLELRCFTDVLALIQYWQSCCWVIWPSKGTFKEGSLKVWFSLDASSPLFGWMGWGCPTLHPSLLDDPPMVDQIWATTNHRPGVVIQTYLVAFIPLHVFLPRNNQLLDHLL